MKNVALTVLLLTCRFTYFNNSCTLDMLISMLLAKEKLYIYIYIFVRTCPESSVPDTSFLYPVLAHASS